MREKPILFSGPLVRAILEGRKTQTRRVLTDKQRRGEDLSDIGGAARVLKRCLYGQRGGQLWVRETWYCDDHRHTKEPSPPELIPAFRDALDFRATHDCSAWECGCPCNDPDHGTSHWKPSIHLPRWASRIDLLVTGIRVARVQDISVADALSEGVDVEPCPHLGAGAMGCTDCMNTGILEDPRHAFAALWDRINAKRGFGWDANPWVWVVDFEVLP